MVSVSFGAYILLALAVSVRVAAAPQIGVVVKVTIWALLWGFDCYGAWLFARYFRRL